jgi:hypothetical protein
MIRRVQRCTAVKLASYPTENRHRAGRLRLVYWDRTLLGDLKLCMAAAIQDLDFWETQRCNAGKRAEALCETAKL